MKLVSVVIPTYNRPITLQRSIKSVQNQTYQNIEIIIVNDGEENINPNILKLGSFSTTIVKNTCTKGACGARNTGLKIAQGDYIVFLDDDDEYEQRCIKTFVGEIEKTNTVMVYSGKNIISKTNLNYTYNYPKYLVPKLAILLNNFIGSTSSVIFKRSWKKSPIWFDESLTVLQDYDLFVEVCKDSKVKGINQPLTNYYIGESSQISKGTSGFWKSALIILGKRKIGFEWTLQLIGLIYIYFTKIIKSNDVLRSVFNPLINVVRKRRQK